MDTKHRSERNLVPVPFYQSHFPKRPAGLFIKLLTIFPTIVQYCSVFLTVLLAVLVMFYLRNQAPDLNQYPHGR